MLATPLVPVSPLQKTSNASMSPRQLSAAVCRRKRIVRLMEKNRVPTSPASPEPVGWIGVGEFIPMTTGGPATPSAYQPNAKYVLLLGLMCALPAVTSDIYLPSLPEVARDLHTTTTAVQLTMTRSPPPLVVP